MRQESLRIATYSGFKSILLLSVVAGAVFCYTSPLWATTVGIVWFRGQGVVIAADSKVVKATQDGHPMDLSTCKIYQYDNLFFAASGVKKAPSFDIEQIAEQSLSGTGTIMDKVTRFRHSLLEELPKVMGQKPPIEFPITFEYAIAGIENCQPVVHHIYLPPNSKDIADLNWRSLPLDIAPDIQSAVIFLGRHHVIDRYSTKHPGWISEGNIFDHLRELIRMEMKASPLWVGEPIDILSIDSAGAHWVGSSPESKCAPLRPFEIIGCPK